MNDQHGAIYRDHRGREVLDTDGRPRVVDLSAIDPQLEPYRRTGERIEVVYTDGERERFYAGKSTGWRPILLKIKTRRSLGGDTWGEYERGRVQSIRGLGTFRH